MLIVRLTERAIQPIFKNHARRQCHIPPTGYPTVLKTEFTPTFLAYPVYTHTH